MKYRNFALIIGTFLVGGIIGFWGVGFLGDKWGHEIVFSAFVTLYLVGALFLSLKYTSWFLAFVAFVFFLGLFSFWGFVIVLSFVLLGGIFAAILYIFPYFRQKGFWKMLGISGIVFHAFLGLCLVFGATFVLWNYYVIKGYSAQSITLQNDSGQKVVFVGVAHTAVKEFYDAKNRELQQLEKDGFVFILEGIMGIEDLSDQEQEELYQFIGIKSLSKDGYEIHPGDFHLVTQKDHSYEYQLPSNIVRWVDMTAHEELNSFRKFHLTEDVEGFFEKIFGSRNYDSIPYCLEKYEQIYEGIVREGVARFVQTFPERNAVQDSMLRHILSAFYTYSMKVVDPCKGKDSQVMEEKRYRVILQERDARVVDYIKSHPEENIAVVYGSAHFDGIFAGLQEYDSSWKITESKDFYPFR